MSCATPPEIKFENFISGGALEIFFPEIFFLEFFFTKNKPSERLQEGRFGVCEKQEKKILFRARKLLRARSPKKFVPYTFVCLCVKNKKKILLLFLRQELRSI